MAMKRVENRAPGQREINWKDRSVKDWKTEAENVTYVFPRSDKDSEGRVTNGSLMVDEAIVAQWLDEKNGDRHVRGMFDEKDGDLLVAQDRSAQARPAADDRQQARPAARTDQNAGK